MASKSAAPGPDEDEDEYAEAVGEDVDGDSSNGPSAIAAEEEGAGGERLIDAPEAADTQLGLSLLLFGTVESVLPVRAFFAAGSSAETDLRSGASDFQYWTRLYAPGTALAALIFPEDTWNSMTLLGAWTKQNQRPS